jgi:hypothetical protein
VAQNKKKRNEENMWKGNRKVMVEEECEEKLKGVLRN